MMLIVFMSSVSLAGISRTQATFQFNAAVQMVNSIVREARSFAVTGKAQIDYSDYDGDGCMAGDADALYPHLGVCNPGPDYVTPANYGVFFNTSNNRLIEFADMHGSVVGQYDPPSVPGLMVYEPGKDMHIAEYTLPEVYRFYLYSGTGTTNTVFFSPIFADTTFHPALSPVTTTFFFVFGVEAVSGARESCMAIHRIAGIPEDATKAGQPCGTT